MTDRELLELAAKAAGIEHGGDRTECGLSLTGPDGRHRSLPRWNPLEDDGDALRLSVKLQLTVGNEHLMAGCAYCTGPEGEQFPEVRSGGNADDHVIDEDYAATRRAIVLAAAEIGKAMP